MKAVLRRTEYAFSRVVGVDDVTYDRYRLFRNRGGVINRYIIVNSVEANDCG